MVSFLTLHFIFQFPFGPSIVEALTEWGVTFGAQAGDYPWQDSEIRYDLRVGDDQKETPPETYACVPIQLRLWTGKVSDS